MQSALEARADRSNEQNGQQPESVLQAATAMARVVAAAPITGVGSTAPPVKSLSSQELQAKRVVALITGRAQYHLCFLTKVRVARAA